MSSITNPKFDLPELPVPPEQFLDYVEQNPSVSIHKLLEPFNAWEHVLRSVFAQDPDNKIVESNVVNLIDVFSKGNAQKARIRGRKLDAETTIEKEKYVMPLNAEQRKKDGELGIVPTLAQFQTNFNVFTESAFANFNWSNVVAAGSAVATCLTPVPEEYAGTLKGKRKYYHELVAPASDIDLFIYGIEDEQAAIDRMIEIENDIVGSLLGEIRCLRTKNCITIVSQYPNRHIQIVLRLYKSISQILTGFDVNCSCVAYDGTTVYTNPRALTAYMTQCNTMDLSRRSPSYESRLAKYSHRGFEIFCDFLDRSKIDPTIFERSFSRTVGLARLLVLEKLPKPTDREDYVEKRKRERGLIPRRESHRFYSRRVNKKDLKANDTEEIPEWQVEDEVSSYNTFTIPYGKPFNARNIEKMYYTRDMVLNAEWNDNNKPPARPYELHRHPAFIGTVAEIVKDCCGYCPVPKDDEEREFYEQECKRYVHGPVKFMRDDPGRQEIGSFNPLSATDYTSMAYIGDQEALFKAIIREDVDAVRDWCNRDDVDINRRDHCGRAPLHVAAMAINSLEIFQLLIDRGARLIARLQDGRTALHIVAGRGKPEFIEALLRKSEANEQAKFEQDDQQRLGKKSQSSSSNANRDISEESGIAASVNSEDSDDYNESGSDDEKTSAAHSFVKIQNKSNKVAGATPEENPEDPDILDVNLTDWDFKMTPLHHAILADSGEPEKAIEMLVSSFGADILQPMKLQDGQRIIMNTTIPFLVSPKPRSISILRTLLKCGATCAQANSDTLATGLHCLVALPRLIKPAFWNEGFSVSKALESVFDVDGPAARGVMNSIAGAYMGGGGWSSSGYIESPLTTAIHVQDAESALLLLKNGASPVITLDSCLKMVVSRQAAKSPEEHKKHYEINTIQPLQLAIIAELPLVKPLLEAGADPSTLLDETYRLMHSSYNSRDDYRTVLDLVREKILKLEAEIENQRYANVADQKPNPTLETTDLNPDLLAPFEKGTWQRYSAEFQFWRRNVEIEVNRQYLLENPPTDPEVAPSDKAMIPSEIDKLKKGLEIMRQTEIELLEKGAKTSRELFNLANTESEPEKIKPQEQDVVQQAPAEWALSTQIMAPNYGESTKKAYNDLFDAAWNGDVDTIKRLCLFDDETGLPKGQILVSAHAHNNITPFGLTIMRGHLDAAKLILTIAAAQYSAPKTNTVSQYTFPTAGAIELDMLRVQCETIQTTFAIDNLVSEAAQPATTTITPLDVMRGTFPSLVQKENAIDSNEPYWDPLKWAIHHENTELVNTLLQWADEYDQEGAYKLMNTNLSPNSRIEDNPFLFAMHEGKTMYLDLLMRKYGLGLDYESLKEREIDSGIGQPPYYLGLTIGGKKRKDWAKRANPNSSNARKDAASLLPMAAAIGNFKTFCWLLSGAPLNCLEQFRDENPDNSRAKLLGRLSDLAQEVKDAINTDCGLLPHIVVKNWKGHQSEKILDFWFNHHPGHLEAGCARGMTPILVAAQCGNAAAVKYLQSKGANILHKNFQSETILDIIFQSDLAQAQLLVPLIPKDDLRKLLIQRSYINGIASTVFRRLLTPNAHLKLFEYLLSVSEGHGLDVFNGDGSLPIHIAVSGGWFECTKLILKARPEMLYRENANGKTPLDISRDEALLELNQRKMEIIPHWWRYPHLGALNVYHLSRYPTYDWNMQRGYEVAQHHQIYEFLLEMAKTTRVPRIRASLMEANELVHRIALANQQQKPVFPEKSDLLRTVVIPEPYMHSKIYKQTLSGNPARIRFHRF